MASDYSVALDGSTLGVRESGLAGGSPVLHFHGTPGSRLEMTWADDEVTRAGVHLVAFDRPGYGRSTLVPSSLSVVARLAGSLADRLGWQQFATLGWSGGGPFALATAAVAPGRVTAVGVISGAGPIQEIPSVLHELTGGDADGAALAVTDRHAAAATFAATFADLASVSDEAQLLAALHPALSERDRAVLARPAFATAILHDMQEAFRQGTLAGGWDNVAWVGPWDVPLATVAAPSTSGTATRT